MAESSETEAWKAEAAAAVAQREVEQADFDKETARLQELTQSVDLVKKAVQEDGMPRTVASLAGSLRSSGFLDEAEAVVQQHSGHAKVAALRSLLQQHWDRFVHTQCCKH